MGLDRTQIEELGTAPKRTTTEEGTIEERDVKDIVMADQYANQKQAADSVPFGIRVARIKPGGTVSGRYPR